MLGRVASRAVGQSQRTGSLAARSWSPLTASTPRVNSQRGFATEGHGQSTSSNRGLFIGGAAVMAMMWSATALVAEDKKKGGAPVVTQEAAEASRAEVNWGAVRAEIAKILDNVDYDDGSLGPIFVRLAWHASGTYDAKTGKGGSNGATMRFGLEAAAGANKGLKIARDALEPIKAKFPKASYADIWTLAAVVAIEEMGGPKIPWRAGRLDAADESSCPPDGRLPDASKDQHHIRSVFEQMGFNDQEIVALAGAHALGRCHVDRSGYTGPWTRSPTTFTNAYFTELLNNKWTKKNWNGPEQFEDPSGDLMMLPADLAFLKDPSFRNHVEAYAKDQDRYFSDFSAAFSKLLELGCNFDEDPVSHWLRTQTPFYDELKPLIEPAQPFLSAFFGGGNNNNNQKQ